MIHFRNRFDPRTLKLLIFDLDGTLIDSRLDLIHSINAMLRHFDRPELPGEVVASYIGDGAPMLVRRALGDPEDQEIFALALDFFLAYYKEHKLDHTTVYDGVERTLAQLAQSGTKEPLKMAVLSNKPVNPSRAIVDALGLGSFFCAVYGGNSFSTKKPDPLGARSLLESTKARPEETLIIGDSSIDVLTGRNAGLWTCGVTYGFAPETLHAAPPDLLVDTPEEIAEALVG